MDVNYELYKLFYKVAKEGNFTKVAEENYISQSAVTQAIKKLETQIGGILFNRSKTGVTLTEEGKALFEYIEESLDVLSGTEDMFSKFKKLEDGNIKILCTSTLAEIVLMNALMDFSKDYPKINISIINQGFTNILKNIANGSADIAIFNLPIQNEYSNVVVEPLWDADMCFFTNKNYFKKISKDIFRTEDLPNYTLAFPEKGSASRGYLDENLKKLKINVKPRYEFSNGRIMAKFIEKSDVIGYANIDIINDSKSKFEVLAKDFNSERKEVGIAYLNKQILSQATKKFIEYLKEE